MLASLFILAALGCREEVFSPAVRSPLPSIATEISNTVLTDSGPRVTVAIHLPEGHQYGGVQGRLYFDPSRLRYAGMLPAAKPTTISALNSSGTEGGELRVLSADPTVLAENALLLAFDVVGPEATAGLHFDVELAASVHGEPVGFAATPQAYPAPSLPAPHPVSRRSVIGRAVGAPESGGLTMRTPGQFVLGLEYGDATLDGAINVIDASYVADVAVGNDPLINGTDSPAREAVVAGNVNPSNLPGKGEATDTLPPGRETNGTRIISVFDVLAISNYAVGNPVDIVGEVIPGRSGVALPRTPLAGTIVANRTLSADTVYELEDVVFVDSGATLSIAAGTRLEADSAGGLVVAREGRLIAAGTLLEPIVFTCQSASKGPGCWGGLVINGYASVNRGSSTSPSARGGASGCAELMVGIGSYGGCVGADSSGVVRYVRIEYAGGGSSADFPAALSLRGIGSTTVVDYVQVQGSAREGAAFLGGSVAARHLVLTRNHGTGARWNDGWTGKVQFLVIQQDSAAPAGGLLGANSDSVFSATPRSAPTVYNTTVVGVPNPGSSSAGAAVRLRAGTAGTIANLIALRHPIGLDIDDSDTCSEVSGGGLVLSYAVWAGNAATGANDGDCITESTYISGLGSHVVMSSLAQADSQIVSPLSPHLPDWRLFNGRTLATTTAGTPPNDGFFDVAATYFGAVPAANSTGSNIPWYSGWTVGAITAVAAQGTVSGTISSSQRGPIIGAVVRAVFGDVSAVTDTGGHYSMAGVPSGPVTLTVSNIPSGCSNPGTSSTTVANAGSATVNFSVTCTGMPAIIDAFETFPMDTTAIVESPAEPDLWYFRDVVEVDFDTSATALQKHAFLGAFRANIVGGSTEQGTYIIRFPERASYASMDSLVDSMMVFSGVRNIIPIIYSQPFQFEARYPNDGSGHVRANWLTTPTRSTWAFRAIRAPLAWGCETGLYGGELPKVGIVEFAMNPNLTEFSTSSVTTLNPLRRVGRNPTPPEAERAANHGTSVASLIAARGDNGQGIAGMSWAADLTVFQVAGAQILQHPTMRVLRGDVLPAVTDEQVRILNMSLGDFGNEKWRKSDADQLLEYMKRTFMPANPRLLIVKSAGNQTNYYTQDSVTKDTSKGLTWVLATLRDSGYANQLVVVAGTSENRVFHGTLSDFIDDGYTDLAAPSKGVGVIDRTGAIDTVGGTSFAAALTTGVAALILSMDSSLSPAQVKDYLVRGAKVRIGPDGDTTSAPEVSGTPGGGHVWQLDAYGSLSLLSREKSGTPICGYPVLAQGDSIIFQKRPDSATGLNVAGLSDLYTVSVAQGGRRIATSLALDDTTWGVKVFSHTGTLLQTIPNITERRYLEKDTADIDVVFGSFAPNGNAGDVLSRVTITGPNARVIYPARRGVPDAGKAVIETSLVEMSPTADWAAVSSLVFDTAAVPAFPAVVRWDLVPIPSGDVDIVYVDAVNTANCMNCPFVTGSRAGWSLDGRFVVTLVPRNDNSGGVEVDWRTGVYVGSLSSGTMNLSSEATLEDSIAFFPRFTTNDSVFVTNQTFALDTLQCRQAYRLVSNPTPPVAAGEPSRLRDCQYGDRRPGMPFNAPSIQGGPSRLTRRIWPGFLGAYLAQLQLEAMSKRGT